jgi:citrate lyase subunit beta/citryl-CoA lyase
MIFDDYTLFESLEDIDLLKYIDKGRSIPDINIKNPKSSLMLNPLKLKHINNIDNLKSDIVVLNLEDGVSPKLKRRALYLIGVFLSHIKNTKSNITVRVNPLDQGGYEEIEFLNQIKPHSIRVAKVKTKKDIKRVLQILHKDIDLHLSIETKESLKNLTKLNIDGRVKTVSLGIMDMLHSLKLPHSILEHNNPTITYILTKFLLDAKLANIYPIGFTYQNYNDLIGYKKWCLYEKSLGYSAKSCLGPKQAEIANSVFSIKPQEITKALYIKEKFEKMANNSITGFMDDTYGFIDEPIYKDALLTLKANID